MSKKLENDGNRASPSGLGPLTLRNKHTYFPSCTQGMTDYHAFEGSEQRLANYRKFLSWQDAGILHPSRNREIDSDGPVGQPLWPSRCDHDPYCLPTWPARLGAMRPAMASGRGGDGTLACSPDQAGNAQRASHAGRWYALANAGHDTRALQAWLEHRNIQHTVRYTKIAPNRFRDFWRD
jgi:hypothetical protein